MIDVKTQSPYPTGMCIVSDSESRYDTAAHRPARRTHTRHTCHRRRVNSLGALDSHESSTQSVTDTHISMLRCPSSLVVTWIHPVHRSLTPRAASSSVARPSVVPSPRQRAHITTSEATHGSRRTSVVTPHPSGTRTPARHVASATVRYTLTTLHRPRTTPPNKVKVQGRSYGRRVLHRTIPLFQLLR